MSEAWDRESRIEDLRKNPQRHRHNMDILVACCMINGALDLGLMQLHQELVDLGRNGGIKCDATEGPCACGAWHESL